MAIPKHVQKRAKAADKLHQELYAPTDAEPEHPDTVEATQIVAEAEAMENPSVTEAAPTMEDAPEVEEVTADPVEATTARRKDVADANDPTWEQRYRSLQGNYSSLREQLSGTQTVLASLQEIENKAPSTQTSKDAPKFLKEEEITEYGADLIDVVRRVAREELFPVVRQMMNLEQNSTNLRTGLTNVSKSMAQSARKTIYTTLAESVPNWEAINKEPAFYSWLGEVDAYAGRKRGEMLKEAFAANDAARVVRFFQGFLTENASVAQEMEPTPTPRTTRASLSEMVAPGRPRGGPAASDQVGKKMWSQGEVRQFYSDVQKGRYKTDEKLKLKLERDIIAAANEGRIAA